MTPDQRITLESLCKRAQEKSCYNAQLSRHHRDDGFTLSARVAQRLASLHADESQMYLGRLLHKD
jgi:hypothetical protein